VLAAELWPAPCLLCPLPWRLESCVVHVLLGMMAAAVKQAGCMQWVS